MSRDDGFPIADVDVGLFADPKVVALARRLKDPTKTASTLALYLAAILESWACGERATVEDAAPAWWLEDLADVRADLEAVGLVDADGRPTENAWEHWYRPAFERRERRRDSGRQGGLASGQTRSIAGAMPEQRRSVASPPLNPSVPSVPSVPIRSAPRALRRGHSATDPQPRARRIEDDVCPTCGVRVRDRLASGQPDRNVVVVDSSGRLGHLQCPAREVAV